METVTGQTPLLVGPGVKTGLNILTDNPAEVGADLVAVAVAAKHKYALPAIIVDLGTATKAIALDRNGAFLGCSIAPGIEISLNALSNVASLLTKASICWTACVTALPQRSKTRSRRSS